MKNMLTIGLLGITIGALNGCDTNKHDGENLKAGRHGQNLLPLGDVLFRVNVGGPELAPVDPGPAWQADTADSASTYLTSAGQNFYTTTDPVAVPEALANVVPPALFQTERWDPPGGEAMAWSFPVPDGTLVELRLYFAETYISPANAGSVPERIFDVQVDGTSLSNLSDVNVYAELGAHVATVRRVQWLSDGSVDLSFSHQSENPMLKGIELVQISPVLYRVNAGGPTLAATDGSEPWLGDTLLEPSPLVSLGTCPTCNKIAGTSSPIQLTDTVSGAAPMALFQTERWDHPDSPAMSWSFDVEAGRPLQVRLLFSETYLTPSTASTHGPRIFDVSVEGEVPDVFNDINIYEEVGPNFAVMKTYDLVSDGQVNLDFTHVAENPMIKGIELVLLPGPISTVKAPPVDPDPTQPSFLAPADLFGASPFHPTSLHFGPDGRLYVGEQDGLVKAYSVQRVAAGAYSITATETINLVAKIPNHDDDTGAFEGTETKRQVTGVLVVGTPTSPVLYVTSSDPRIGGGGGGTDTNLDTNSGVLSRLTWQDGAWNHEQLVRGLPRSEENHASNGMALDKTTNTLYVAQGGHTNAGAPSNNFAFSTEYALSAAILSIDLNAIDALPVKLDAAGNPYRYDLPTLDDPTRTNQNGISDPSEPGYDGLDQNDPFGGNDGLNQAKLVLGGPVQIHSSGWRNPYDVVLTQGGKLYSVDNGANGGWGGHPVAEGAYPGLSAGLCTQQYDPLEPGSNGPGPNDPQVNNENGLHHIRVLVPGELNYPGAAERYYAGHPAPVRGNPIGAGLYYNGVYLPPGDPNLPVDWPPVPASEAHPAECDFRNSGETDGAMANYGPSTNGITEYTASNFGGAMQGDLLMAAFNGTIYQAKLDETGNTVTNCPAPPASCNASFASGFGSLPLDLIAQGDDDPFPGTVWVALYGSNKISVFEPTDFGGAGGPGPVCNPSVGSEDSDNDGYSNEDELHNFTNPCSAASQPEDNDEDLLSDLLDPDDDNDDLIDVVDAFALDPDNGFSTALPLE